MSTNQVEQYLLGRHIIIHTDHAALSWLKKTAEPMPQLARWLTLIEQYDYEIVHRPGVKHGNADGLSRRPVSAKYVSVGSKHELSRIEPTYPKDATDEHEKVRKTEQSVNEARVRNFHICLSSALFLCSGLYCSCCLTTPSLYLNTRGNT